MTRILVVELFKGANVQPVLTFCLKKMCLVLVKMYTEITEIMKAA